MLKHEYLNRDFLSKNMKIIDIRTRGEWEQTGIVKDSILITFFDEFGRYNTKEFLSQVDKHISQDEEFAIICRTGSRTVDVGNFLASKGYKVTNLMGGIYYVFEHKTCEITQI
jgi:rhodanese-related sulfurtransferase